MKGRFSIAKNADVPCTGIGRGNHLCGNNNWALRVGWCSFMCVKDEGGCPKTYLGLNTAMILGGELYGFH